MKRAVLALLLISGWASARDTQWAGGKKHTIQSKLFTFAIYEPKTRTMTLKYKTGAVVEFYAVPPEIFDTFMSKRIKGGYFKTSIDGKFRTQALKK